MIKCDPIHVIILTLNIEVVFNENHLLLEVDKRFLVDISLEKSNFKVMQQLLYFSQIQ